MFLKCHRVYGICLFAKPMEKQEVHSAKRKLKRRLDAFVALGKCHRMLVYSPPTTTDRRRYKTTREH